MSDPLGARISALNLNDAQPIPATLSDSSSAAFANHCVSNTGTEKAESLAGSRDCHDDLPSAVGNKTLNDLQIATASEPEATAPNHDRCGFRHSDACWNDHRWIALNQQQRAIKEQRMHTGTYEYIPCKTVKFLDEKYQLESGRYINSDWSYSHVKITKCTDGKVLVNLLRDFLDPLHRHFRCRDQDWILTGHTYLSPVLVNLTTGNTYEQGGDHYFSWNFLWQAARASLDGNTLAVLGLFWGGYPEEIRFYDFSNPDQGFRPIQSKRYLWPTRDGYHGWPTWQATEIGDSVGTFYMQKDNSEDAPVYSVTVRRAGDRMIEARREMILEAGPGYRSDSDDSDSNYSDDGYSSSLPVDAVAPE
ncbi:hypothetical protein [Endozoicomonas sp. SCSIO W0465]|uniref:hypothetical protein n=1 Tax=Endozoicomonas sp. SCSIO W0465 TaxID=2918516 RepID=UPI0020756639|nr:hypothetical protein [Endozoicomonas sp. SCSIO W0465]USE35641.1 hypothetical protein MJO57_26780 [Endozoicomonas sp. SCSIO W0465]